jgi:hypothetical protein
MRPTAFNILSLEHKNLLVEDMGQFLFSKEYYDHRIHLYSMNNMFVEAYYNIESKQLDSIVEISYADLDKYLSQILIYDLIAASKKPTSFYL